MSRKLKTGLLRLKDTPTEIQEPASREIVLDPAYERVVAMDVYTTTRFGFDGCVASCMLFVDGEQKWDFALIESADNPTSHKLTFKEPVACRRLTLRAWHKRGGPATNQEYNITWAIETETTTA